MNALSLSKEHRNGFSLIELLIAVSIFLIITVAAIGSMVHLQGAARRGEAIYSTLDNLNLAVDSMARLMRTGYMYHCDIGAGLLTVPRDCAYKANPYTGIPDANDGATSFAFLNQTGTQIQYRYISTSDTGYMEMRVGTAPTNPWVRITSSDINITHFRVYIQGAVTTDTIQPYAVIVLAGNIMQNNKVLSSFNIQTSMTQRLPDTTP